jgi:ABC-type transport system substrate-binding protein
MAWESRVLAVAGALIFALCAHAASTQKTGGTLRIGHFDSPASMSMFEEPTAAVNRPMTGVFNNLAMFKQDEPQNTPESIVPELATEWRWSEDGSELTFLLHRGVRWHDGKPREYVQSHPVATKRAVRAILKATDLCATEPVRVARQIVDGGFTPRSDYAAQSLSELPYDGADWRFLEEVKRELKA